MKSDINTLGHNFNKEELQFIEDYFRYVREKMYHPTHPEIHIGAARYPLGRLVLRSKVAEKYIQNQKKYFDKRGDWEEPRFDSMRETVKCLNSVIDIYKDVRTKGKTVKATRRKKNETDNNSTNKDA